MKSMQENHSKALASLSDEDLNLFFKCGKRLTFEKGQDVVRQGQLSSSLFAVSEGVFEVRRQVEHQESVVGKLEPGSLFGEMSLFDPGLMPTTVRAISPGVAVEITKAHLESFIAVRPEAGSRILFGMLEYLAGRCRQMDRDAVDQMMWGAPNGEC